MHRISDQSRGVVGELWISGLGNKSGVLYDEMDQRLRKMRFGSAVRVIDSSVHRCCALGNTARSPVVLCFVLKIIGKRSFRLGTVVPCARL